jgi:hypothetical protein
MSGQRSEQEYVTVAVVSTAAEAEFVKMTLLQHGLAAYASAADPMHPSLNFVDGVHVSVPAEDEEEALALLGRVHDQS